MIIPEDEVGEGGQDACFERGELLTEGEFEDRLLASVSEKGRNTAKEDRREFEEIPHDEARSAPGRCGVRD